ncbi:MAG: two-component system, NtrC family, sensor kinase [Thermodesulfobacteriota bacterium]|nr:two-component system, NtrC family, sensor kinase [Thermodesulfobacteriota bacterium]
MIDKGIHYKRLRLRIVIMSLCFSLIPLLVLGFTIYTQFSKAYSQKITETLRILVQNRKSALEIFLEERVAQLVTLANTHTLYTLVEEAYLSQVFSTIQSRSKSFIDIGVIDQNGTHLAYVGPHYEKLKGVNYAHEDWFRSVMESGVFISDVFLGFRKIPHFIIAVTRREGSQTWILRATINTEIIDNIVRLGQLGKKGDAFIVNSRNILQTAPRFSGRLLEAPKTPDFSSSVGTTIDTAVLNGVETFFAASQLNNPRWTLVVREDASEEMAPLFEARYWEGIILLAGILCVAVGTIVVTRSMTNELIRVEQEKAKSDDLVMQSSKMAALGKMAAGVAHEINNPLQIISDQAGWMKDLLEEEDISASKNFEEFQECIRKIERHLERCRSITHRLLRFGRRMEPTQDLIDVNEILKETITFLETEARHRDIAIEMHLDEGLPRITSDQAQLQQVFLNIVDNAIDAIGKKGSISIVTEHRNGNSGKIHVEISDTGPGIPKDKMSKIFDPFFTTKSANEGTGLGLSISYSIIEKLGGTITVDSEVGCGSTFKITLPVTGTGRA